MSADDQLIEEVVAHVSQRRHQIELFRDSVVGFFRKTPDLNLGNPAPIHSLKSRIKDDDHLREKLRRKICEGADINVENVFQRITDLAGVRVMHLHTRQFTEIDRVIRRQIADNEWVLHEEPKAYTWDPETSDYFGSLGLETEVRESYYTSVHYVVRPRADAMWACEIQVRTLFEEIWGEIDHSLNYPEPTTQVAVKEQLRVLAKLVAAGSRLAESIFNSTGAADDS